MDIVDEAKELEQHQRQAAIARVTDKLATQGSADCIDCDEPIPEARRTAYPAARRCISCQKEQEQKTR